jgi:transposase
VGETADVTRFKNDAAFARHAGLGPTPNWSADDPGQFRHIKTGNRQLNSALHRIALTQIRMGAAGADYYRKRIDANDDTGDPR